MAFLTPIFEWTAERSFEYSMFDPNIVILDYLIQPSLKMTVFLRLLMLAD